MDSDPLPTLTPPVPGWTPTQRRWSTTQLDLDSDLDGSMANATQRFFEAPSGLLLIRGDPTFVSVVGGPAVGKSSTIGPFMRQQCPGIFWHRVDKDHLLRWFSTYRRWNHGDDDRRYRPLTKRFARCILKEGLRRRASMAYVGTGSDVDFTLEWLNRASKVGYRTIILDVRCSDQVEWMRRLRSRRAQGLHPAALLRCADNRRIAARVQRHRTIYHRWARATARASVHVVDTSTRGINKTLHASSGTN